MSARPSTRSNRIFPVPSDSAPIGADMATRKNKGLESALVTLLEHPDPERRQAACIVVGELDLYSPEAAAGLRTNLKAKEAPSLRIAAAEALGRLGVEGLAVDLQPLLVDREPGVRQVARQILASAKRIGRSDLEQMLKAKDEKERLGAVGVLGARGDAESMELLAGALAEGPARFTETARNLIQENLDRIGQEGRVALVEGLRQHADPSRLDERPSLAQQLADLVGGLNAEPSPSVLLGWCTRCKSPGARAAAASGLRRQAGIHRFSARQYEQMLEIVEDDQTPEEVLAPLAEALVQADLPLALEPRVRRLASAEHRSVRTFALRALGTLDTAPAAKAIAGVVKDGDATDRKTALAAAVRTASGRSALAKVLASVNDEAVAESVVQTLRGSEMSPSTLEVLEQSALDAPPEVARVILGLLKQVGSEGRVQGSMQERARKLKNRGELVEAAKLFERIASATDDAEARFQLGICQLRLSKKHISRSARQDPAAVTFATLARRRDFHALDRLVAEPEIGPDELFFLGFALAENDGDAQNLGGDILTHLNEAHEGSPIARRAHNKLVTMGWEEA